MKLPALFFFCLTILFVSCEDSKTTKSRYEEVKVSENNAFTTETNSPPMVVKVNSSKKTVNLSEVVEVTNIVPLETTRKSLLGTLDKLVCFEEKIYVLDSDNTNKLAVFSDKGEHLANIGSPGNGPGEYSKILDFAIDKEAKKIIMLEKELNLLFYELDGTFIESQSIKTSTRTIEMVKQGIVALYSDAPSMKLSAGEWRLRLYDYNKKEVISKHMKSNPKLLDKVPGNQTNFSRFNNFTYITASTSDTIYRLSNQSLRGHALVQYEGSQRPDDFFETLPPLPASIAAIQGSVYASPPYKWYETDDFVSFFHIEKNAFYYNLIAKPSLKPLLTFSKVADDFGIGMTLMPIGVHNNQLVVSVDPGITKMIRQHHIDNKTEDVLKYPKKYKGLLENLKADDNPIIVFLSVKKQ